MENKKYPNLLCFLEEKMSGIRDNIALGMSTKYGWKELTFNGVDILCKNLGAHLINRGTDKGDKVAIISESCPEWTAVFFGSVIAGLTIVPIDIKLTIHEMKSILSNCEPKLLIVSNKFIEYAKTLKDEIHSIEDILIMNEASIDRDYKSIYELPLCHKEQKWRHRGLNKTALIIYTSGTTGNPKGVEISYKNMLSQVRGVSKCFPLKRDERMLSILPMNHLYELSVGFLTFLNLGVTIYYPQNLKPDHIFQILFEKRISFMVVVPAFLKLIKSEVEADLSKRSDLYKMFFKFRYFIAQYIPSYHLRRFLFRNITRKLGGKFKGCISGGAPLDVHVSEFINRIGIRVFQGYGLSEAAPVVSMSTQKYNKQGYVGRAIDGVSIKIDEETGELMVKGDNVMRGYYGQPELTKETITEDGWLHTGDIAEIDKEGYLKITGRIKNMIVLSGGKKVFPEEVETALDKSSLIKESCVIGAIKKGGQKEGTEYVAAVVVPTPEVWEKEGENTENVIRSEVSKMAQKLAPFKRPTKIVILKEPLPRTATSKVKRKEVASFVN